MKKFGYKDGCVLCNQCGRLYETVPREDSGKFECPCGNAEELDAIHRLVDLYNPAADDGTPDSEKTHQ